MANIDLHVHSKFSNHPSEWFLQRIGASESYTEPEYIYAIAKERGMDFVTITDHNCIDGALLLKERHPADTFVSMEATTYFPENRCKIHVLLYDITEHQFDDIQHIRNNIYDLNAFIRDHGIAHSVAHATYSINGRLTEEHLEKLILMFDVFEGHNGSRTRLNNEPWSNILSGLTPEQIEILANRHNIEPSSDKPWVKGFTGGSDDHSGMFIARAYTRTEARNTKGLIENIRSRRSIAEGRYSNYQSLAFTIYKIAYDFSKRKSGGYSQSLFSQINESLFASRSTSLRNRFKFHTYKSFWNRKSKSSIQERYMELYETITACDAGDMDTRLEVFYDKLGLLADEFFKNVLGSVKRDLKKGDIVNFLKSISSSLPGIFLTVPFFSTLRHLFLGRRMVESFAERMGVASNTNGKRVLWFTDTLTHMNGVSKTVRKIGWLAYLKRRDLNIVTCLPESEINKSFPPNVINLPRIDDFNLPYYEHYILRVPSLLRSIKMLHRYEPDEVIISTPGPVGLFGLLTARLLNARAVGIYHTDFTLQARKIADDDSIDGLIEGYMKWFYSMCDEVRVPTREYIDILDTRGYDSSQMTVFSRGIDAVQFAPHPDGGAGIKQQYHIPDGPVLMFAGRISRDKNIHTLFAIFNQVRATYADASLIIAGSGPDHDALSARYKNDPRIIFTGEVGHDVLPDIYSAADVFVFPSTTDTFGMVVLEAQACGLPAVVSDKGGPQEIIDPGITGLIAPDGDLEAWVESVSHFIDIRANDPDRFAGIRRLCRQHAIDNYDWNAVITEITGDKRSNGTPEHSQDTESASAPPTELMSLHTV